MAENTAVTNKPETPKVDLGFELKPTKVVRNNAEGLFRLDKITKGRSVKKGQPILVPDINADNLNVWIDWLGKDNAAAIIGSRLRPLSQGWLGEAMEEAKDPESKKIENGDKVHENFVQFAQEFSARGETIKELQERILELIEEMSEIEADPSNPDDAKRVMDTMMELKRLKVAISRKKRKDDEDDAPASTSAAPATANA